MYRYINITQSPNARIEFKGKEPDVPTEKIISTAERRVP